MVQLEPAPTVEPQLLVSAKLPEALMLLIARLAVPPFVRVTDCAELVVSTPWLAKVSELGDRLMPATATPVPVTGTSKLAVEQLSVR